MLKANFELLCREVLQALNNRSMQEISGLEKKDYSPKYIHVHSTLSSRPAKLQFSGVKSTSAERSGKKGVIRRSQYYIQITLLCNLLSKGRSTSN